MNETKDEIEWLKEITSDSTARQVAILMADPEGLDHPMEAILGVYSHPPDAFDEMDNLDIEGASVTITTFNHGICEWTWEPFSDHYETDCGEGFQFMNGGVEQNNYEFCPHCGREIVEVKNESTD